MRPVIGIIPLYDDEKESYWMLPGYMKVLEQCGALPVMLPLTEDGEELAQVLVFCDGLLLTGGHDVSPEIYGEMPSPQCGILCSLRDRMEFVLLKEAVKADKPVLGICRGVQFINAALGGTLYQDLPTERPGGVKHRMEPPYNRVAHTVTVLPETKLAEILGAGKVGVNSYHHQAIKKLAQCLRAEAVSEDGLTEAVCLPGRRFVVGVQWHPEFSYRSDENSVKLVQAFVDACKYGMEGENERN